MTTHPLTPVTRYLLGFSLLVACGAPPAPAPAPPPLTWAEIAPQAPSSPQAFKAELSFELWLAEADQASVERLEARLSSSSVLADVNGSGDEYQVTMGELSCALNWSTPQRERRAERAQRCAEQVKADQAALVQQAKGLISVTCQASSLAQALDAHKVASAAARDLEAILTLPSAGLCRTPSKPSSFKVNDFVSVVSEPMNEDDAHRVCSRGLTAFSQPELCLAMVDASRVEVARETALSIVDGALRGAPLSEGAEVSRGPATGTLVSAERFKTHLKRATPQGALVVVNPKAKASDVGAQRALMMRFTTP